MRDARLRGLKVLVFGLCLVPLGKLALQTFGVAGLTLGANPVDELLHRCGIWGLNFLLITLAVSPARQLTGWAWITRFRRMLGLFAFFYVLLHFLVYLGLDQRFAFRPVLEDVIERPYITVGFAALLILTALAATSTRGMMRRLGRRWKTLHRLVYPAAVLGYSSMSQMGLLLAAMILFLVFSDWFNPGDRNVVLKDGTMLEATVQYENSSEYDLRLKKAALGHETGEVEGGGLGEIDGLQPSVERGQQLGRERKGRE